MAPQDANFVKNGSPEQDVTASARRDEIYAQISASLVDHYDTLYYVDIDTGTYTEISSTDDYKKLNVPATGNDFFAESRRSIRKYVHPEDQEKALRLHYKDVMLENLRYRNSFSIAYRLVVNGVVKHIRHTEIMARDEKHIIVCIEDIDAELRKARIRLQQLEIDLIEAQREEAEAEKSGKLVEKTKEIVSSIEYSIRNVNGRIKMLTNAPRRIEFLRAYKAAHPRPDYQKPILDLITSEFRSRWLAPDEPPMWMILTDSNQNGDVWLLSEMPELIKEYSGN